mmetsp:Transcript_21656/g.56535  ORF Transcript_21656/g.56535 Transcript_21656/m.56535 type:complete len:215 (-) Transcript_21656:928-1572(-)
MNEPLAVQVNVLKLEHGKRRPRDRNDICLLDTRVANLGPVQNHRPEAVLVLELRGWRQSRLWRLPDPCPHDALDVLGHGAVGCFQCTWFLAITELPRLSRGAVVRKPHDVTKLMRHHNDSMVAVFEIEQLVVQIECIARESSRVCLKLVREESSRPQLVSDAPSPLDLKRSLRCELFSLFEDDVCHVGPQANGIIHQLSELVNATTAAVDVVPQ